MTSLRPRTYTLLFVSVAAVSLWHIVHYWDYVLDDTYISLRYARNLVDGYGLVFNPGERVEGYTNLTFVLLAALCLKTGIDPIVGLKIITAVAALATLWLAARLEAALAAPAGMAERPITSLLLIPLGAFVYWACCPMETMLFTALFLAALMLVLHETTTATWRGSGIVFALLALTRPEGLFIFLVCTVVFLLIEPRQIRSWSRMRCHAVNTALFTVVIGGHVLWRYVYYGDLLPNTFYAKVTGGPAHVATGVSYLGTWLRAFPILGATLVLPVAMASARVRTALPRPALLLAVYIVTVAYGAAVVAVGGDFMPFFRFFIPVLALCAVLAAVLWRAAPLPPRGTSFLLVVVLLIHVAASIFTDQPYRAFVAHRTALVGEEAGTWFAEQLESEDLMAVNTAGSLPYYSRLPTIDMLGLTDAQIARRPIYIISTGWAGHRRGWGRYVLERQPRVILWYNSAGSAEPFYLGDHELADDPVFRFFYQLRVAILPPIGGVSGKDSVVRHFLGFPFGFSASGKAPMPSLGLTATFSESPVELTRLSERAIRLTYFEFDARDEALWEVAMRLWNDVPAFVDAAAAHWQQHPVERSGDDRSQSAAVAAMCAKAHRLINEGDHEQAKRVLETAARVNREVRSPLVYHYIANLAVITKNLLTALDAQKEALRLAPQSQLYRDNLRHLLTVPLKDFGEDTGGGQKLEATPDGHGH